MSVFFVVSMAVDAIFCSFCKGRNYWRIEWLCGKGLKIDKRL